MWLLLVSMVILLCAYVGWRSAQALFAGKRARWRWMLFIMLTSAGFFLGLPLRGTTLGIVLRMMGTAWMITLPYWLLAVLFFDVVRISSRRVNFLPEFVKNNYVAAKRVAFVITVGTVGTIFAKGYWNFSHPVTTPVSVVINKSGGARQALHAAVVADLHLGDIIGRERVAKYVAQINALNADIIFIAGDTVDQRLQKLIDEDMGAELAKLHAPLGVFAVIGNHERYAGAASCIDYLGAHGIRILRDEVLLIDNSFYLVGRLDTDSGHRDARKSMLNLLQTIDLAKPIIVLDHQPIFLEEAALAGVDLQLSGHTHHGQVWPVSWIVEAMYDVAYGLGKKDDMQIYVTSGLGLWGLPARIGTVSEIVDMRIEFRGNK